MNHITRSRRQGITLCGTHHGHHGILGELGFSLQIARGSLSQQLSKITTQARDNHLTFRVPKAHVVLNHLEPLRGQHEPGVQHPAVVNSPCSQFCQRGLDELNHHLFE